MSKIIHQQILSLSMEPTMTGEQVNSVIKAVNSFSSET